jgi:hypothetical protein
MKGGQGTVGVDDHRSLLAVEPPEVRIVVAGARVGAPDLSLLADGDTDLVDWARVERLAQAHAVTPLLHRHLTAGTFGPVPSEVLDRMQHLMRRRVAINYLLARWLVDLVRVLGEAGVPCIPFKGPTLALLAYDDLFLRSFGDLDLFIPSEGDLPAFAEAVERIGFVPVTAGHGGDAEAGEPSAEEYHSSFAGPPGVVVEAHWDIAPRFFLGTGKIRHIWRGGSTLSLLDSEVPCLTREEYLFLLTIHGSKHLWDRLGWVVDVAELIRRSPEIDWSELFARAHGAGSTRMLHLGLKLARDLLGAPLPAHVERKVAGDHAASALAATVYRTSLVRPGEATTVLAPRFFLNLQDSGGRRLRFLRFLVGDRIRRTFSVGHG